MCGDASFQLTPSRRATFHPANLSEGIKISTHALTEGDCPSMGKMLQRSYFNSRPHGGRPVLNHLTTASEAFQLTPSRRATSYGLSMKVFNSFQLTPSRRATVLNHLTTASEAISTHALTEGDYRTCDYITIHVPISTHALTEGDGKFRQIFLLNRGYAYSISLYFLPHFISLLPQILSFQQKSFKFQVRIFLLFSVHLVFALQNQCVHHVKSRFCTNMFYFVFVLFTQIVKPQTIGLFIYDFF